MCGIEVASDAHHKVLLWIIVTPANKYGEADELAYFRSKHIQLLPIINGCNYVKYPEA